MCIHNMCMCVYIYIYICSGDALLPLRLQQLAPHLRDLRYIMLCYLILSYIHIYMYIYECVCIYRYIYIYICV